MSGLDHACNVVALVAAAVNAAVRIMEHSVFVVDFIGRCASMLGIDLRALAGRR